MKADLFLFIFWGSEKGGGSETEVTWEDQQNINKFGRLNNRFHELEDEIKIAKVFYSTLSFHSCLVYYAHRTLGHAQIIFTSCLVIYYS